MREDIIGEALKEEKFVEKIRHMHLQVQVHETIKRSEEKYKTKLDQHRTEKSFKVGDRVCL
jgi:transposase-like protein